MLFVADLHYALKQFDWLMGEAANYDAVVIGGDLLDLSSALDIDVQIVVVDKYLHRLRKQTHVVVCSGNHDLDGRNAAGEAVAAWLQEVKRENIFVDGTSVEFSGALLTICPCWDGAVSRAEVETQLVLQAGRSSGRWIWVYHAPPADTAVCWNGREFAGDEFLRDWIKRFAPDIVLSGHIHNAPFYKAGSWVDRIGKTRVFNVGRQPGPCPTFISLDPNAMTAVWNS
jgi:Icc-related predicted phosphoesterase